MIKWISMSANFISAINPEHRVNPVIINYQNN